VLGRLTEEAEKTIAGQTNGKPFFLYLALTAPHTPIVPSPEFKGRTRTTDYGDFCYQVDDVVGRVLAALARQRLETNTLVVFTADNGCSPQADFDELRKFHHDPQAGRRGYKADIYEGGHRVPFIVRWPGKVAAGRVSTETVCQSDLLATCAELLGRSLPANSAERQPPAGTAGPDARDAVARSHRPPFDRGRVRHPAGRLEALSLPRLRRLERPATRQRTGRRATVPALQSRGRSGGEEQRGRRPSGDRPTPRPSPETLHRKRPQHRRPTTGERLREALARSGLDGAVHRVS
jgi:hypothetical protein